MDLPRLFAASGVPAFLGDARIPRSPPGGSGAGSWQVLSFSMQAQLQENWCWAATAASVATFYDQDTSWTQCRIADAELGRGDCCGNGAAGPCNVPWSLDTSLGRVGRLDTWSHAATSFATIQSEIDAGNPLCARIAWRNGSAHFVALIGYIVPGGDLADGLVIVADPQYGEAEVGYAEFRTAYRDTGTWTHSYRCK